jgi:hypothetical protein
MVFSLFGATAPSGPGPPHSRGFYITHNDAPHSVIPLWTSDQPDAKTTHNTHNRKSSMVPVGLEAADPRIARPLGSASYDQGVSPPGGGGGLNGRDLELTTILHLVPPMFRMSRTIDLPVLHPYALMAWTGTVLASILSLPRLRLSAVEGDTETMASGYLSSSYPTFRCFPT